MGDLQAWVQTMSLERQGRIAAAAAGRFVKAADAHVDGVDLAAAELGDNPVAGCVVNPGPFSSWLVPHSIDGRLAGCGSRCFCLVRAASWSKS
jgi:hypothetical protein